MSKLEDAIKNATTDIEAVRENIRAVKGDKFADFVDLITHAGLTIRGVGYITGKLPLTDQLKIGEMLSMMAATQIATVASLSELSDDAQKEAQDWATKLLEIYAKHKP
jgi:hypothetical protein